MRLNDLLILVFGGVQYRAAVLLLRWAQRRFSGQALKKARAVIVTFSLIVVFGFLMSLPDVVEYLGLNGSTSLLIGAAALIYFITLTGAMAISIVMNWIKRRTEKKMSPGRRRVLSAAGNVLMAAPLAVIAAGFVARKNFQVHEIDVPIANLPDGLNGLRILQLSDIHLSAFLSERDLARVIDASNELRANLAVVTGDLISTKGDPLDACIRQLTRVKSDAGMFGVLGNHERFANAEDYCAAAGARAGIPFLRGETRLLRFGGAELNITGVDYQSRAKRADYLKGAEKLILPGAFNLLLQHNPDVFPVAAQQGFDLQLSGHTHGGQVTVEILEQTVNPARFITPYVHGLYRKGRAAAYVTRGIGTIGIPARIGAMPEIAVLKLRKA